MNDEYREYEEIIRRLETLPQELPREQLTQTVMAHLQERDESLWGRFKARASNLIAGGEKEETVSKTACSFYYFITGFFYLLIGVVSTIRFQKTGSQTVISGWMGLQPYIAIGTALWLFILGIVLRFDGQIGVRTARYGTLLFVFASVVNSILLRPCLHIPYALVFIIGLAATCVMMGVILVRAVQKMELRSA